MSLNNVIAFALLLKKITRKGSMGKKSFQQRMRRNTTAAAPITTTVTATANMSTGRKDHISSMSSYSSSDEDEEEEQVQECDQTLQVYQDFSVISKKSSLIISAPSIKSLHSNQIKVALQTPVLMDEETILDKSENEIAATIEELQIEQKPFNDDSVVSLSLPSSSNVIIRDFAYPTDSPLHFGRNTLISLNNESAVSLSSPDFNGRDARALFDFTPETEYEIGLKAGQTIWVQYRQCPGWLIADVQDETGLIPESYVEFI